MSPHKQREVDLLVTGGLVVTLDDEWTVVEDGAIAIEDGAIVSVDPSTTVQADYTASENVDAAGHIVMPGLVNAHTHAATSLFRGFADDRPLKEWLEQYIWPAEQEFVNPDTVRWGTLLAMAEMLRVGVTLFVDMYFHEEMVAEAAIQSGMRVVLGELLFDIAGPNMLAFDRALDCNRDLLERYRDVSHVSVSVQPHSTYTVSPDNLVKAKALADEYGALFGLHASETAQEVADVRARTGFSPVRLLDNLALLGPSVLLFHGVHLDDEEIELLAETATGVVHCPEANLKLASGIARLPDLLGGGVRVGLGTDGPASNNDFNMWGEIQTAAKIHRGAGQDMMATSAKQIVYMATRAGADLLGFGNEIGSLEPGKRADIILIDLDQPHLVPMYDVYSHLAYAVGRSDVTTTIIDGRLVMRNRRLLTLDEDEVVGNAREVSRKIRQWLATR